jgi:hypothetical protein
VRPQCSAAARPNTTRSSSEFEPSRFAPCTETQARFTHGHEAGHYGVRIAVAQRDDLALDVAGNSAHVVVDGWQHRDRLPRDVDTREDPRAFGDAGQALVDDRGAKMLEMQVDVVLLRTDAAALADLDRHRAADDVA